MAALVLLSGCGSSSGSPASPTPAVTGPVTVAVTGTTRQTGTCVFGTSVDTTPITYTASLTHQQ